MHMATSETDRVHARTEGGGPSTARCRCNLRSNGLSDSLFVTLVADEAKQNIAQQHIQSTTKHNKVQVTSAQRN